MIFDTSECCFSNSAWTIRVERVEVVTGNATVNARVIDSTAGDLDEMLQTWENNFHAWVDIRKTSESAAGPAPQMPGATIPLVFGITLEINGEEVQPSFMRAAGPETPWAASWSFRGPWKEDSISRVRLLVRTGDNPDAREQFAVVLV